MKGTFYTGDKDKKVITTTRDLTLEELTAEAERGNLEARKEIYKLAKKDTVEDRIIALEELNK